MTDIAYAEFLREAVPFAPDVPEPVAIHAIRSACIEFCEQTLVYLHQTEIDLFAGEGTYEFDLPSGTALASIQNLWHGERQLRPTTLRSLANAETDWRSRTGDPIAFTQIEPSSFTLYPAPAEGGSAAATALLALKPTRSSVTVWSELNEKWGEVIGFGARSRMYLYPGIYQSDVNAARDRKAFAAGISAAIQQKNKGYTQANLTVQMPRSI